MSKLFYITHFVALVIVAGVLVVLYHLYTDTRETLDNCMINQHCITQSNQ